MVSQTLDGLTDEQLADLELQESGLVSGQGQGAVASTPFATRDEPKPEPQQPAPLSDYELNQLEEENYRRVDYVMTPDEFNQYWDRRNTEDREVGRFFEGLGQGAKGLVGMAPEAGKEIAGALRRGVTDPIGQAKQNLQTGAEIVRKSGVNLVQLYDWVSNKVNDISTSSKRAEAINAGIMDQLVADKKLTGDRAQDEQIYQAALADARKSGAYKPTAEQAQEDRMTAYERYVREKSYERDTAKASEYKTGTSEMSSPTTADAYQITDEKPLETISTLGAMVLDPVNLIPTGAGALSKARVLRRMAVLSEKPFMAAERAAGGLADIAERVETGLTTRIQDITGLTQKQQAALGAGVAGTAIYVDQATDSKGGLTKAVMMVGSVLPALHYGGGILRKVGPAAGGAATVVREAGVGGIGVARAEAAAGLAGNAAIPERYRKFFTGYVEGTDSTLKRVAQDAGNPEALRRTARFADRMGATQVARAADDVVSGAVTAGIVGTPFAALQPDAERAGEVMGGILAMGAVGGLAGGFARRRSPDVVDADIARMFADVQSVGGNVEAFSKLPHPTLDRLSAMQGVLAGKVDFVPLSGDEYRMNADIAQNAGETTAGVFVDKDANNRARVFINLDAKTKAESIAPHEIGHAILTSDILDGQPRADLRNLVNQQYGVDGVTARGREYISRLIDGEIKNGTTGESPTVMTEAEMNAFEGGKTMDDIVADRATDPAERDRLINQRMEEFSQRSIDKGQDPLDWARDEIVAETFASESPAIEFRAIRRDGTFPRIAESMLSAGSRVMEMFGAKISQTGKLMDNPSVLFRDNPLFQDRIMQKRVREYVRSYDQFLVGLEETGSATPRGVELARSSSPADLGRSTHVKLRDEGRGVLENDFLFQKPDGTYAYKPQPIINRTEASRAAQIKTLYDARKFVPVNSTEFGKRKVNGRETVGGPVLPPQFDLFTQFPKHVREFARAMEQSRADGGSWDIDYNAIGTGSSGRYRITNMGAVRAIQRETVPFGWQVTKQNHLLAASLDLNAFRASSMKAINKGELGVFNNDMKQVEADLKTYLANHRGGFPGEATIGVAKRDMLNGLIGTGTAVQRTANPLYYELNPKGSIRSWRVDRLNDAKPTGRTGYFFDYDKINNNRMPQAIPRSAQGMPDVASSGRGDGMPDAPRRYVSMEKFIEEAGDELSEVLPNAYRNIEFDNDDYPTHLVSFSDARNSMYRSRVPSKEFFDWLHSDKVMDGLVFDKEYTPARPGEGAGHTRESYQAVIDRLRDISLRKPKPSAAPRAQAMPDSIESVPTEQLQRQYEENQGYLGLSTLGMREGRPVRGGAAQTRELLRRNDAISAELQRRGVREEDAQLQGALQRRGQAMPDVSDGLPRRDMQSRGKTDISDDGTVTYSGKEPKDWSPQDFAEFGKDFGVRNLGPLSNVSNIVDELGRPLAQIPGGLDGKFTYYDLLWLKTNAVDVKSLPVELHGKLTAKLARTMTPERGNDVQKFNGILFGMLSPNSPLLPNEFGQARMRFESMDDIRRFANLLPDNPSKEQRKAVNQKLKKTLGFTSAKSGGLGIGISVDLSNIVIAAKMFAKKPDFFIKKPNESWANFVDKLTTQVGGLGTKTASFGGVWQDPLMAGISAMDRHMARAFSEELLNNPDIRGRFEGMVVKRFNDLTAKSKKTAQKADAKIRRAKTDKARTKAIEDKQDAMQNLPDPTALKADTLDDVLGQAEIFGADRIKDFVNEAVFAAMGSRKAKYLVKGGAVNPKLPESLQGVEWVEQPKDFQVMSDAYRLALDINAKRAKEIGIEVFPSQWTLWDRIRGRVEPHEAMFPGLERLPALNDKQLAAAYASNKQAGYARNVKAGQEWKRKSGLSPSSLAYFTPAVLAVGAAASATEEQ
jgi:hypothetical protein